MRILRPLWTLALLSALVLGHTTAARPEGSASLYPSSYGGNNAARANLDVSGASAARYANTVKASTFLYVFAQAGEYILVGSSNRKAGAGGDIRIYDPQDFGTPGNETYDTVTMGTPTFSCAAAASPPGKYSGGTLGHLATRVQELAGPNSADNSAAITNGFAPCAYQAPTTGIYGVIFTEASSGTILPTGVVNPGAGVDFDAFTNTVAAWDVTVRASAVSTVNLDGRLFTYAFAGSMGSSTRSFYSSLYYVTGDGYRYWQQWRGVDPASYVLYSNTFGFLDNGQPLYKDLRGKEQRVTSLPPGVTSQIAQNPVFFSDITPGGSHDAEVGRVLSALSIPLTAPTPVVSNVTFVGSVSGSTSSAGVGGTFTFDSTDTISYQIVISFDGVDFNPENASNRTLTGIAFTGSHAVAWDGKNNGLATFPAGGPYSYVVSGRNGEAHFPLVDAETNAWGGPIITRLNGIGAPSRTIYFDDRGYVTRSGGLVGHLNGTLCDTGTPAPPVPPFSLVGIDSGAVTGTLATQNTYARLWGVPSGVGNTNTDCSTVPLLPDPPGTPNPAWGDTKAVDTWTFFSLPATTETLTIVATIIDVAAAVSTPATAAGGSTVQGSFQFANNGTASAPGVTYALSLTPGLGTVTFTNLPTGTTASYSNGTGIVTFGGTPLPTTLAAGQSVLGANGLPLMSFSYTAPGSGSVLVTATISTSGTDDVPSNNTASASTGIGATDVATTVGAPATAVTGTPVSANFQFSNLGSGAAATVTYGATIGSGGNRPAAVTFVSEPGGITASYDSGTGLVTFTGMPATLVSGQSLFFGFSYIAPAPGSVPISTSIGTSSVDANAANNAATGTTTITAAPFSDMSVDLTGLPGTAQFGVPYTGTFGCTNSMSATADALGATCAVSGLPAGVVLTACTISPVSAVWTPPATVPTAETVTCTVAGTLTTATSVTVTVTTGATNDPIPANNSGTAAIAVTASDMSVSLGGLPGAAQFGVPYTGSFACANSGTASTVGATCGASGLPAGVVLTGCIISPTDAPWTPPATVPIGQTVTCTVAGTPTSATSVTVTVTAGATNDPITANNTGTASIAVTASDLIVNLTGLPAGAQFGVSYTGSFSCTNSGTASAVAATCAVSGLPAGVVLTGCTISPPGAAWTSPATIPIGATVTCAVGGTPTSVNPATVTVTTGATNDPITANNSGTAPIAVAGSDLSVDLAGLPATAQTGVSYTGVFSCTNSAAATADALDAACDVSGLPAGVVLTGCTISPIDAVWTSPETIPIGQTVTCTVAGTPTSAGLVTVTVATGAVNDPNLLNDSDDAPIDVTASDLSVDLAGLPATAQFGAPYTGTFSCTNSSSATAGTVGATCTVSGLPAGVVLTGCTISPANAAWTSPATIPIGETVTCTVAGTPTTPGPVTVTVTTEATNDPIAANNTGTAVITVVSSDLSIDLAGLPGTSQFGVPYAGTFSCTNAATATADALNATCGVTGLPAGVVVTGCTISPTDAPWTSPATIPIGQTVTCTVSGIPTSVGPVTVTGTTGATNDPSPADDTATTPVGVTASDLSVSLAGLPGAALIGVPYTGTFSCTNSASATADATGASCGVSGLPAGVVVTGCTISPTGAPWTAPATIPIGQTVTCAVAGTPTSLGSPTVTGTTGAANDSDTTNDSSTSLIVVAAAPTSDMAVAVTGFSAASSPGAPVTGTITCTNVGDGSATDASCGATGLPLGATLICSPPSPQATLAAGLSITCTVSFTAPGAGTVTVTGTTGASNDLNPANNSAVAVIRVVTANDDGPVNVDIAGGTVPVLANDTVGTAVPVVGVDISLPTILDSGGLSGLTFNASGELVVPSDTAPGLYIVTYQICALNPTTACDTAAVQITVGAVPIPVGSPETLAMLALFMLLSAYVHQRWRAARGGP